MPKIIILSGNMGDQWRDQLEAAESFGAWVEKNYRGFRAEVRLNKAGKGDGVWDEQDRAQPKLFRLIFKSWRESKDAKRFIDWENAKHE